jgi:hypothetical protein
MDDREVPDGCGRNSDVRNPFGGRRQRREKREREMAQSISKLRTMGPVPGIDRVERFELRDAGSFHHSHQIQAGIGNRSGAVRKANQGQHRTRSPDLGVNRACGLECGKRKNDVANRARPN